MISSFLIEYILYFLQKNDIMLHFTRKGSSDATGFQCLLFVYLESNLVMLKFEIWIFVSFLIIFFQLTLWFISTELCSRTADNCGGYPESLEEVTEDELGLDFPFIGLGPGIWNKKKNVIWAVLLWSSEYWVNKIRMYFWVQIPFWG